MVDMLFPDFYRVWYLPPAWKVFLRPAAQFSKILSFSGGSARSFSDHLFLVFLKNVSSEAVESWERRRTSSRNKEFIELRQRERKERKICDLAFVCDCLHLLAFYVHLSAKRGSDLSPSIRYYSPTI